MSASSGSDIGADEARQRLYDLMRSDVGFGDKTVRALELANDYLGVETTYLTRVDATNDYWAAIECAGSPDEAYPIGLSVELGNTYCRVPSERESSFALHDAPAAGWADDPAYETFGIGCYLGVPVTVADECYGTVCFVADAPRPDPFPREEVMFAELVGRLLGQAITKAEHETELAERKQLVDVLARVLRHNLRNDLGVVRGFVEAEETRPPGVSESAAETIVATVDGLLALSDKIRPLTDLVSEPFERRDVDVESVVRDVGAAVESSYPGVTVAIEGGPDTTVRASPRLRLAFEELLENAAKHGGDEPAIDVSFSRGTDALEVLVADDGAGLPEHERTVLETGRETPLEHGSGLGCWMVYWIVARHGGRVAVEDAKRGTAVTVTIPFGLTKLPPKGSIATPADDAPPEDA